MKVLKSILLGGLFLSLSTLTYAEMYYEYNTDLADEGIFTLFTGGFAILYICLCLIGLVSLIFWVLMLIDVIKRTETELPDRTTWIILIVLLGSLGALLYYFMKKRPLDKKSKS